MQHPTPNGVKGGGGGATAAILGGGPKTVRHVIREATPSDATPVEASRDGEVNQGEGDEGLP